MNNSIGKKLQIRVKAKGNIGTRAKLPPIAGPIINPVPHAIVIWMKTKTWAQWFYNPYLSGSQLGYFSHIYITRDNPKASYETKEIEKMFLQGITLKLGALGDIFQMNKPVKNQ